MRFGRYGRNPIWGVIGVLAVIYGIGVAFGSNLWGERMSATWLSWGAGLLGVLFVIFMVVPFVMWLAKGAPETG